MTYLQARKMALNIDVQWEHVCASACVCVCEKKCSVFSWLWTFQIDWKGILFLILFSNWGVKPQFGFETFMFDANKNSAHVYILSSPMWLIKYFVHQTLLFTFWVSSSPLRRTECHFSDCSALSLIQRGLLIAFGTYHTNLTERAPNTNKPSENP